MVKQTFWMFESLMFLLVNQTFWKFESLAFQRFQRFSVVQGEVFRWGCVRFWVNFVRKR